MEKASPFLSGAGIAMVETAITLLFPLITYISREVAHGGAARKRGPLDKYLFIFHGLAGSVLLCSIFLYPYRLVSLVDGQISLEARRNGFFYLALCFCAASLLPIIITLARWLKNTGYKREKQQALFWIVSLSAGLIGFIVRFYFSGIYRYGAVAQFFLIVMFFYFIQRYGTIEITAFNVTNYVYSLVKTPILILRPEGTVALANQSAVLFFQKAAENLTGAGVNSLFDFGGQTLVFAKEAGAGNHIDKIEAVAPHNKIKCEIDITYTYDSFNELLCVIFIINDISSKENLIQALAEEKQKADLANQAKSAFLANTSHEIRTPMNAIIGMSELALRENIPPEAYEHIIGIRQAGNNLLSIINDILDFSKIESGRLEIIPVSYHLGSIINDVVNIIRMRVIEKSLAFVVDVDPGLPNNLLGDEVRVRQILLNLLSNAVKYTEQGFIRLSAAADPHPGSGPDLTLKITVEDSGIGIKEADLDKVFGEFIQVDMTANKGIEGTGLGLAITKRLCRAMGGDVTAVSAYGKGSVFTARISQKRCSDECFALVEDTNKSILVYEDRLVYGESLARSLENLGVPYTLVTAEYAFDEALRQKSYAYIFAARSLYEYAETAAAALKIKPRMVVITEYGAEAGIPNVSLLTIPVHVLSIANVLNNKPEPRNYAGKGEVVTQFTAPSARILIVDDIVTNLKVAQGLMVPYLALIDTCKSGPEAIELMRKNKYDLIFMDHMMPGMDGIEAVHAIRNLEGEGDYFARVPIVALTANAVAGMKKMFLDHGFNDYVAKPIEMLKLHDILGRWIPAEKQIKTGHTGSAAEAEDAVHFGLLEGKQAPGINIAAGMERYKNDRTYLEILTSYFNSMPNLLNTIRNVSPETLGKYAVTVHGIKGASYQICADEAGKQAEALEMAAKASDWGAIKSNNGLFLASMNRLLGSLEKLLKETAEKTEKPPAAFPNGALLRKLLAACRDFDILGMDETLRELEKFSYASGDDLVVWLRKQLDIFDYDGIQQRLEALEGENADPGAL
jgi:signal transduction histidine kinase/DNA-binding response OmpR family regulator